MEYMYPLIDLEILYQTNILYCAIIDANEGFVKFFKPCKGVFILEILSLYCCYPPLLNLFLFSKKNENQLAFFNDATPRLVFSVSTTLYGAVILISLSSGTSYLLKAFRSLILVSKSRSGSV